MVDKLILMSLRLARENLKKLSYAYKDLHKQLEIRGMIEGMDLAIELTESLIKAAGKKID